MTRRSLVVWISSAAVGLGFVTTAAAAVARHRRGGAPPPPSAAMRAPQGVRVKVEVINATKVRGLARQATELLRDQGFDVVSVTTTTHLRDSTVVIDRSSHDDWSRRIAGSLGNAQVQTAIDSSHYVDATVLVGASWRPPREPFHP